MKRFTILTLAVAALVIVGFKVYLFLGPDGVQQPVELLPDDGQVIAVGVRVYEDNCAQCHGRDLEGEVNWRQRKPSGRLPAPPHDETGHTWHHPDQALFELTKYGPQHVAGPEYESDMPAYEGILSDEEIIAVLSYIKSTWDVQTRATHDEINRRMQPQ